MAVLDKGMTMKRIVLALLFAMLFPVGAIAQVTIQPSANPGNAIVPVVSASAENSHILKSTAGNVYSVYAVNLTATAGFLILLNSATVPVDGAVTPLACAPLNTQANSGVASINFIPGPMGGFTTGIVAVVTSAATCFTKTTGVITAFIGGLVQ